MLADLRKLPVYFSFVVVAAVAVGLAACGDDSSDFSPHPDAGDAVLSFDDLSNCTAKKAGALEFVKDSPYVCVESGDKFRWEKVSQTEDEPEDFKVCNQGREGQYALASKEDILYTCSDEEWIPVGGVSSSSGKSSSSSENAGSSSSAKSSDSGKDAKSSSSATSSSGKDAKSSSESSSSVSSSSGKSSSSGGTSSSVSSSSVTSSSEVRSSSSIPSSFSVGDDRSVYDAKNNTLTDYRDGQVYRTVTIGEQTWMAENLNFAYLVASDSLDSISVCYKGDSSYCSWYGRLYTWAAAMDSAAIFSDNGKGCGNGKSCYPTYPVRGACPKDWHLPTQYEWTRLIEEVGDESEAGRLLKSTKSWFTDEEGTDAYEFSVLPAGMWAPAGKQINGWYNNITEFAYFWTSTDRANAEAHAIIFTTLDEVWLHKEFKYQGYSVRCVKD